MKRTKARPAAIISIVVVVIAAVLAVFYFCFTREFLQTFMSDKTYAEYTIAKNSKEYVPKVTSALKKETSKKYAFSTDLDYKYDQGTSFDSVFTNSIVTAEYLHVRQDINFKIMQIVSKHGAQFAFPSQSLYVESLPK